MNFYGILTKLIRGILSVFILFKVSGSENIPRDGAFLLCANHHSNMDPVLIAVASKRQLTFMAKEELFKIPVLGKLIKALGAFPIKRGKGDAGAIMATLKILNRGGATLIFPEGRRVKRGTRIEVNPGIIKLAMRSGVPILPANVGKNSVTFFKPVDYSEYAEFEKDSELMRKLTDGLMDTIYKS